MKLTTGKQRTQTNLTHCLHWLSRPAFSLFLGTITASKQKSFVCLYKTAKHGFFFAANTTANFIAVHRLREFVSAECFQLIPKQVKGATQVSYTKNSFSW